MPGPLGHLGRRLIPGRPGEGWQSGRGSAGGARRPPRPEMGRGRVRSGGKHAVTVPRCLLAGSRESLLSCTPSSSACTTSRRYGVARVCASHSPGRGGLGPWEGRRCFCHRHPRVSSSDCHLGTPEPSFRVLSLLARVPLILGAGGCASANIVGEQEGRLLGDADVGAHCGDQRWC